MNEKKVFFSGIMTGFIVMVFLSAVFNGLTAVYSRYFVREMDIKDKVSAIYNLLDRHYVDDYDKEELMENMYYGMVKGIGDRYTSYMDKGTLAKFIEQTEGVYAGIGVLVELDEENNEIFVSSPFEGMPGARAGLLPGDVFVKVNATSITGDMFANVADMLKGQAGTTVAVTVFRPSTGESLEFDIVREEVTVPTVFPEMLPDQIGYIRISNFERHTYEQFMGAYKGLQESGMESLIIDVRNNPGGYLNVVTDIANELIPEGYIVYTEDRNGNKEYINSDAKHIEIPLAVIVNGDSASASEILAGAIKDTDIGELVGTRTFGKGLVQNLFTLPDQSGVKITIAKYYTPSGVCINGIGIVPDYVVELSEEQSLKFYNLPFEEDAQLVKAVEVMKDKMWR